MYDDDGVIDNSKLAAGIHVDELVETGSGCKPILIFLQALLLVDIYFIEC